MTTDSTTSKLIINRLTATQFNSAVPSNTELYAVDPEFTGGKGLMTNSNGEIVENPTVTDLTSTTITLANAAAGTTYKYGTLTALTITANDDSSLETIISFTTKMFYKPAKVSSRVDFIIY